MTYFVQTLIVLFLWCFLASANILALEMAIYNFSGRQTVENIFHVLQLTIQKRVHGYKTNLRRNQEAVSLLLHRRVWVTSVVMDRDPVRLSWGRAFTVGIDMAWSRRADWSKCKPARGAARSPVPPSGASQPPPHDNFSSLCMTPPISPSIGLSPVLYLRAKLCQGLSYAY